MLSDRRQEILNKFIFKMDEREVVREEDALDAMDDYMKECCLELLEFMANNSVDCLYGGINNPDDKRYFYFKREWITREQLFESFL